MKWFKRWQAKHWQPSHSKSISTRRGFLVGTPRYPPLRRAARWLGRLARQKPIELAGVLVAAAGTVIALIAILR